MITISCIKKVSFLYSETIDKLSMLNLGSSYIADNRFLELPLQHSIKEFRLESLVGPHGFGLA